MGSTKAAQKGMEVPHEVIQDNKVPHAVQAHDVTKDIKVPHAVKPHDLTEDNKVPHAVKPHDLTEDNKVPHAVKPHDLTEDNKVPHAVKPHDLTEDNKVPHAVKPHDLTEDNKVPHAVKPHDLTEDNKVPHAVKPHNVTEDNKVPHAVKPHDVTEEGKVPHAVKPHDTTEEGKVPHAVQPHGVTKDNKVPQAVQKYEVTKGSQLPHAVQEDAVNLPSTDGTALASSLVQVEMSTLNHVHHSPTVRSEVWKKGGRLLSALLAINVGLIACVLVSSGSLEEVVVQDVEVLAFLVILMLLSTFWMIFQFYFSCRKNAVLYKDSHAGPVWLRGGLVFFGICSLVLDVFKIGYYISYIDCESPIKLIHPMVQSAFIILQTYFLWVSSKHCVQIHTNISRYGLMLVLITNLSIWMAAVTDESVHQTQELEDDLKVLASTHGYHDQRDAGGAHGHTCRCSNHLCHIFQTGYYYLYPFNIEYSLFASAMTYVMWKNVGRQMDDTMPCHRRLSPCFCFHSIFVGLIVGCVVLLGGVVVLVTYKVKVNLADKSHKAHIMFYSFNIVVLSLMSMGCLTGSIIYRFDQRHIDGHKNPTRTLDVALLLGAALGQYCISYYSIVAMVATSPGELINVLNLLYSLLMIIQLTLQNTFIIEGLHREPFIDEAKEPPKDLIYSNEAIALPLPDGAPQEFTLPVTDNIAKTMHNAENHPWNMKRRLVQEISLFLLLCNVILWLMPAFGARPQLKNNLELKFYGPTVWTIITNISLPFGIFYRMHGAASLLEVFRMS